MSKHAILALFLLGSLAPAAAQDTVWEARPGMTGFGTLVATSGVVVTGNVSANKGVIGLDWSTGKLLWRVPGKMLNGPASDGRNAYVTLFVNDVVHKLVALELKSGKVLWSVEGPGFGSRTDVLVDSGRVYVAGEDGKARAFDAATGKVLWTFAYSPAKGFCPTTVAASGGAVFFGGGEETYAASQGVFLWALDAASGEELWRFAAKPESYSRIGECLMDPAVSDGIVAVTSSNILYALDAKTGATRWNREIRRVVEGRERRRALSAPHISGARVYAIFEEGLAGWTLADGGSPSVFDGHFPAEEATRRLESDNGQLFFTANFEQPELKGNRQGFLYAFDPVSRQVTWRHRVNRPSEYTDPAVWSTTAFAFGDGAVFYENFQFVARAQPGAR